jgi:hypothetical protein
MVRKMLIVFFLLPFIPLFSCWIAPMLLYTDNDRLLSNCENRTPSVMFSTQVESIRNINSVSISAFPYFLSLSFLRWRPDTGGRALFELSEELRCCTLSSTVLKMEDCYEGGDFCQLCLGQWMKRLDKKNDIHLHSSTQSSLGPFASGSSCCRVTRSTHSSKWCFAGLHWAELAHSMTQYVS